MRKYILLQLLLFAGFTAFSLGGRPYHSGPGIAASQTLHLQKPAHKGRDTTAIYIDIQKTQAPIYNQGEANELTSAQVYKSYSKNEVNLVAGLRGYRGAYRVTSPDSKPATYGGAGVVTEIELAARGRFLEFILTSQFSCLYEFGDYQRFQRQLRSHDGDNLTLIWKSPIIPHHSMGLGLNFKPGPDLRFGFIAGVNFPAIPAAWYGKVHTNYRSVGVHYVITQPWQPIMSPQIMYGTSQSIGISYALPFGRSGKQSKGIKPQIPDDQ